ncbi:hypothetical protein K501DRAFT_185727 [Backusella circina FSU 941]|nr:hypothetical protein K501DRAFT_185727 [Backusella circina FSU 941]
MYLRTLTVLLASFITIIAAQKDATQHGAGIYITNPVLGTKINGGSAHTITWDVTDSNVANIDSIELRNGETNNLKLIDTISSHTIPVSDRKFEWKISPDTKSGTSYVLMAKSSTGMSYSAYFTILGTNPGIGASGDAASVTSSNSSVASPQSSPMASPVLPASASVPVFNDYITAPSTAFMSQTTAVNNAVASASGSHRANSTSASNILHSGMFCFAGAIGMTILLA